MTQSKAIVVLHVYICKYMCIYVVVLKASFVAALFNASNMLLFAKHIFLLMNSFILLVEYVLIGFLH